MIRTCTIRHLDERGLHPVAAPSRMAALRANVWAQRCVTCLFLDGTPGVQAQVKYYAALWSRYAGLTFCFVKRGPADVRITFADEGSWSYIGTDALGIAQDTPTMCFGWLEESFANGERAEVRRVTLHEFGHALGLIHEHQNPKGGIRWNEAAVYAYYMGPPNRWSREQTFANVIAAYDEEMTNGSAYDPKSIMNYPIPEEFVLDPAQASGWNDALSDTDRNYIAVLYPRALTPGATFLPIIQSEGFA